MSLLMVLLLCQQVDSPSAEQEIRQILHAFHQAAAKAERTTYFGFLAKDAVFMGTDGTERWSKDEFEAQYGDYMDGGKGWTFVQTQTWVSISAGGQVAWFDENLDSEHYGKCRGSGVLVKQGNRWLIAQYNLSVPMPNDLAKAFVAIIRAAGK